MNIKIQKTGSVKYIMIDIIHFRNIKIYIKWGKEHKRASTEISPKKNRIQFVPTTRVLKQNHSCGSECHDTKQFRQWKKANFVPMFLVPFDSSVENFWCNCCVAQLVSSMRVNLKWMNINQLNISKVLIYEKIEKNNLTNIQIIKRKKI